MKLYDYSWKLLHTHHQNNKLQMFVCKTDTYSTFFKVKVDDFIFE